jgi:hypothetical protein
MGGTADLTGGFTIAHVLAQEQFQGHLPPLPDLLILRDNLHLISRHHGTGREEFSTAILDQAKHAGGEMVELIVEAEGRNVYPDGLRGLQHRSSLLNFYLLVIYPEFNH